MITAILVDDEEKSLMNLELLLKEACPDVKVIDKATNALQAVKCIINADPDLVFLDVHMPGYSGFDVLDSIRDTRAIVVFTTAHKNYAINALRKGAFDYLLKPVDTDELKECVERVRQKHNIQQDSKSSLIELSVKDGIIFVKPADIIRLEASGSYTVFHLENNIKHMVSKSMKEYEGFLDPAIFFRCHNSHIINLSKVVKFIHSNGYFAEMQNGVTIEIARKNKELLLEKLKKLHH